MCELNNNQKKQQAKDLILIEGLSYKETGARLGVLPKTIGNWSREHGWNKQQKERLRQKTTANSLYDFIEHLRQKQPQIFETISPVYREYINKF